MTLCCYDDSLHQAQAYALTCSRESYILQGIINITTQIFRQFLCITTRYKNIIKGNTCCQFSFYIRFISMNTRNHIPAIVRREQVQAIHQYICVYCLLICCHGCHCAQCAQCAHCAAQLCCRMMII